MGAKQVDQMQGGTATENAAQLSLCLYVLATSPKSLSALFNLLELAREYGDRLTLEVVDAAEEPGRVAVDRIFVYPTLVKLSPAPIERIEGDLSNQRLVLSALGMEDDAGPEPSAD